eukprot:COSAG02_NODE_695_length_18407_cov_105.138573_5_plen_61_part_00
MAGRDGGSARLNSGEGWVCGEMGKKNRKKGGDEDYDLPELPDVSSRPGPVRLAIYLIDHL